MQIASNRLCLFYIFNRGESFFVFFFVLDSMYKYYVLLSFCCHLCYRFRCIYVIAFVNLYIKYMYNKCLCNKREIINWHVN